MKTPLAGGTPVTLASAQDGPYAVAVDTTSVYWVDYGNENDGTVRSVPLAGGTPTTLASNQSHPVGIAVDAANVYWINDGPAGAVMKVATGGGAPSHLL